MKYLIIEDEKAAARNLKAMLEQLAPDMELIDVLDSVADTIDWFGCHTMPELVFMDIHLADGSAFEIFEHTDITCPIIFTTAYDEYALRAFKVNSIDYLLKPIDKEEMQAALTKLERLHPVRPAEPDFLKLMQNLQRAENYKTHFLVPVKGDKLLPLAVNSVSYFYIADGIVKAVTTQGKEYVINQTLDELTECLNPQSFFRANRQYIINVEHVLFLGNYFGGKLIVRLKGYPKTEIQVSKEKAQRLKEWIDR